MQAGMRIEPYIGEEITTYGVTYVVEEEPEGSEPCEGCVCHAYGGCCPPSSYMVGMVCRARRRHDKKNIIFTLKRKEEK